MRAFTRSLTVALLSLGLCTRAEALSTAEKTCLARILSESNTYISAKNEAVRLSVLGNASGLNRSCAATYRCTGGPNHGAVCTTNATCGTGECHLDRFEGTTGLAKQIRRMQNRFKRKVDDACDGVNLANLGYPSADCPGATSPRLVVDCLLRSSVGDIDGGEFADSILEPVRRVVAGLGVPHPPARPTYPKIVCGVPGSGLLSGPTSAEIRQDGGPAPILGHIKGRDGYTRLAFTENCSGDTCQTRGEPVVGNMLDDPETVIVGPGIPVCVIARTKDVGNGTTLSGSIDLRTGAQASLQKTEVTMVLGQACPICDASRMRCIGGLHDQGPCVRRGAEDISCPPASTSGSPVIQLDIVLSTEPLLLTIPPDDPSQGSSNAAGVYCGACDGDVSIGCQNDSECVSRNVCSGQLGSGCCQFGSNVGFLGSSPLSIAAVGKAGPLIPYVAGVACVGKTGTPLLDAAVGLPGPFRLTEPRVNVFSW